MPERTWLAFSHAGHLDARLTEIAKGLGIDDRGALLNSPNVATIVGPVSMCEQLSPGSWGEIGCLVAMVARRRAERVAKAKAEGTRAPIMRRMRERAR